MHITYNYKKFSKIMQNVMGVILLMLVSLLLIFPAKAEPWRVSKALNLPAWVSISGLTRARFETVDEQFRAGGNGDDQAMSFRTSVLFEAGFDQWEFAFEVLDARQAHGDESTPINTSLVNPFDVLQAYVQYNANDFLLSDSISAFKVGRFTIDLGSRRLLAKTIFRNTDNAFTGINWTLERADNEKYRVFFTLPVNRLPNDPERLIDNETEADDQDTEVKFWGLYYMLPKRVLKNIESEAEVYYFGLNENDTHNRNTRNRDLQTIGARIFKSPQRSEFDYQIESAIQFGQSRSNALETNRNDLDHFAQFYHAELGYSFDHAWSPRLIAQFDFASGDDDPEDDDNNRFDTLFGARRFDVGPIGIFGPFALSNVITPGVRLLFKPAAKVSVLLGHRAYWLASDRDALVAARVQDPAGESGSFAGQQFEARVRWDVYPNNLRFEVGGAYVFQGEFLKNAPNASGGGDPNYLYGQVVYKF